MKLSITLFLVILSVLTKAQSNPDNSDEYLKKWGISISQNQEPIIYVDTKERIWVINKDSFQLRLQRISPKGNLEFEKNLAFDQLIYQIGKPNFEAALFYLPISFIQQNTSQVSLLFINDSLELEQTIPLHTAQHPIEANQLYIEKENLLVDIVEFIPNQNRIKRVRIERDTPFSSSYISFESNSEIKEIFSSNPFYTLIYGEEQNTKNLELINQDFQLEKSYSFSTTSKPLLYFNSKEINHQQAFWINRENDTKYRLVRYNFASQDSNVTYIEDLEYDSLILSQVLVHDSSIVISGVGQSIDGKDIYIVKLNQNLNIDWVSSYRFNGFTEQLIAETKTLENGNLLLIGHAFDGVHYQMVIQSYKPNGEIVWEFLDENATNSFGKKIIPTSSDQLVATAQKVQAGNTQFEAQRYENRTTETESIGRRLDILAAALYHPFKDTLVKGAFYDLISKQHPDFKAMRIIDLANECQNRNYSLLDSMEKSYCLFYKVTSSNRRVYQLANEISMGNKNIPPFLFCELNYDSLYRTKFILKDIVLASTQGAKDLPKKPTQSTLNLRGRFDPLSIKEWDESYDEIRKPDNRPLIAISLINEGVTFFPEQPYVNTFWKPIYTCPPPVLNTALNCRSCFFDNNAFNFNQPESFYDLFVNCLPPNTLSNEVYIAPSKFIVADIDVCGFINFDLLNSIENATDIFPEIPLQLSTNSYSRLIANKDCGYYYKILIGGGNNLTAKARILERPIQDRKQTTISNYAYGSSKTICGCNYFNEMNSLEETHELNSVWGAQTNPLVPLDGLASGGYYTLSAFDPSLPRIYFAYPFGVGINFVNGPDVSISNNFNSTDIVENDETLPFFCNNNQKRILPSFRYGFNQMLSSNSLSNIYPDNNYLTNIMMSTNEEAMKSFWTEPKLIIGFVNETSADNDENIHLFNPSTISNCQFTNNLTLIASFDMDLNNEIEIERSTSTISGQTYQISVGVTFENGQVIEVCKQIQIVGNNHPPTISVVPIGKLRKFQNDGMDYSIKIYKVN